MWVWVKIEPPGSLRFDSMFPFTRVPCWVPIFDSMAAPMRIAQRLPQRRSRHTHAGSSSAACTFLAFET